MSKQSDLKAYDSAEKVIEVVEAGMNTARDILKLRIAFLDRLTLLNGGVLALSFTAATALRGHTTGDGGVGYLFAAWKLLLCSTAAALVAQWMDTENAENVLVYTLANRTKLRIDRHSAEAKPQVENEAQLKRYAAIAARADHIKRGWYAGISRHIGTLAQVLSLFALYWLYKFGHTNFVKF